MRLSPALVPPRRSGADSRRSGVEPPTGTIHPRQTSAPTVSLLAAVATNRAIGINGALPWRLPADLRRFKRVTMGSPIIMGRRTYDSIGAPLPGRRNIVITRAENFAPVGAEVAPSPRAALNLAADDNPSEIFIIGGAQIYEWALREGVADRMHLTEVACAPEADAFFPPFAKNEWRESAREPGDAESEIPYAFVRYDRVVPEKEPQQ